MLGETINIRPGWPRPSPWASWWSDADRHIENIERHREAARRRGRSWTAREMRCPRLVSTLCICIVFRPCSPGWVARYLFAARRIFAMLASYVCPDPGADSRHVPAEAGTRRRDGEPESLVRAQRAFERASSGSGTRTGTSHHPGGPTPAVHPASWALPPRFLLAPRLGQNFSRHRQRSSACTCAPRPAPHRGDRADSRSGRAAIRRRSRPPSST